MKEVQTRLQRMCEDCKYVRKNLHKFQFKDRLALCYWMGVVDDSLERVLVDVEEINEHI